VKVDDGARRAAEMVMGVLLGRLGILDAANSAAINDALTPAVKSRAGETVGAFRPGAGLALG
jgi:L-asparaginase II